MEFDGITTHQRIVKAYSHPSSRNRADSVSSQPSRFIARLCTALIFRSAANWSLSGNDQTKPFIGHFLDALHKACFCVLLVDTFLPNTSFLVTVKLFTGCDIFFGLRSFDKESAVVENGIVSELKVARRVWIRVLRILAFI